MVAYIQMEEVVANMVFCKATVISYCCFYRTRHPIIGTHLHRWKWMSSLKSRMSRILAGYQLPWLSRASTLCPIFQGQLPGVVFWTVGLVPTEDLPPLRLETRSGLPGRFTSLDMADGCGGLGAVIVSFIDDDALLRGLLSSSVPFTARAHSVCQSQVWL